MPRRMRTLLRYDRGGEFVELRQLRYALTLSETLHFRRAAEREYITPSALSQQIAKLETELGARLFERSSHNVRLTPAGQTLVTRAREVLAQAEGLRTDVVAEAAGLRGLLRIGLFAQAAAELTPLIMSSVASALPYLRLEICELHIADHLQRLLDGEVDVAVLNPPIGTDAVEVEPLFHEPRYALLPSASALAAAPSLRLSDLVREPHASAPGASAAWRAFWGAADGRTGPRRPGVEITTVSETLFSVAYHGIAVTFPASAVRRYPLPGVTAVPLVDAEPGETAVAARAGDDRPEVVAFKQIAREVARHHIGCVPHAILVGE